MSSFGELIGRISPGARDLGRQLKVILDEPADRARELLRQEAGNRVAASEEGQKIKMAYVKGKLTEFLPVIVITIVGGLMVIILSRRV